MSTVSTQIVEVPADSQRSPNNPLIKVFKWYNWEHANFKLEVKALTGFVKVYMNHIGENSYLENAYSVIGMNEESSEWFAYLDSTD